MLTGAPHLHDTGYFGIVRAGAYGPVHLANTKRRSHLRRLRPVADVEQVKRRSCSETRNRGAGAVAGDPVHSPAGRGSQLRSRCGARLAGPVPPGSAGAPSRRLRFLSDGGWRDEPGNECKWVLAMRADRLDCRVSLSPRLQACDGLRYRRRGGAGLAGRRWRSQPRCKPPLCSRHARHPGTSCPAPLRSRRAVADVQHRAGPVLVGWLLGPQGWPGPQTRRIDQL